MVVIAGLGNPGLKYKKTRHNVGFDVIDLLAKKYGIAVREKKYKALLGKGTIGGMPVLLVKPQTFMNLSGDSIGEIMRFYKLDPTEELIVISDDVALAPGAIRIRKKGSAGGHNGLKNIISCCGTDEFIRVRVGVGEVPIGVDMVSHVLGKPRAEDRKQIDLAYECAADAIACILTDNVDLAMSRYNGKVSRS